MYLDQFWIAIISRFLTEKLNIAMIFFSRQRITLTRLSVGGKGGGGGGKGVFG